MPPKSRAYNIAIIPPKNIGDKAVALSRHLKKHGGSFTLNQKDHFPHLTLYMTEFPVKNLSLVKQELQSLASQTHSFQVSSKGFGHSDGWVSIEYPASSLLLKFQKKIISRLNSSREGLIRKVDQKYLHQLSVSWRKDLKIYGFNNPFYKYWLPHITLTKLKKSKPSLLSTLKKSIFSFTVKKFGLFECGEYSTCRKLVKEFKLN